ESITDNINKEADEAYDDQLKLKLKAQKHVSPDVKLLLNLKIGAKERKRQWILEEIRKALGEGLGAAPNSPNHSDSSDNSIWESTDDDKTESDKDSNHRDDNDDSDKDLDHRDDNDDYGKDFDAEEDQTIGLGILVCDKEPEQPQLDVRPHSPNVTATCSVLGHDW
nr:hypothetical protein [Tanacetum cinerariifolium]